MRSRRFGVEIECGHSEKGTRGAELALRPLVEAGKIDGDWARYIGVDGSGVEIRSPILCGPDGFAQLKRVMRTLKKDGWWTSEADGMHVHHDAPEFLGNPQLVARLVRSWVRNRQLIEKFVDDVRWDNSYCPKWYDPDLQNVGKRIKTYYGDEEFGYQSVYDRYDLNVLSLDYHGSIEIRLHEGTLEFEQAEAWIRFGQAFLNRVLEMKGPMSAMCSHEMLLKRIKATKRASAQLAARAKGEKVTTLHNGRGHRDYGDDGYW